MLAMFAARPAHAAPDGPDKPDKHDKPVLMVIYFDNLTGVPDNDVMKKGLADMMITDLIAHDGITVVERDKLEAVLGELHLQGSAAFDPATRARLGKLAGARYLVSGSMLGVTPEVRLDARLTDITTGANVVSASVRGAPDKLFDLEQDLVRQLTRSIDSKLIDATAARKLRSVDVQTMLAYSKGLDLEDKGQLEQARKQYSEVLKQKPAFALPRDRTEKLVKKMAQSESVRSQALSSDAQALVATVETTLAAHFDQLPVAKQDEYLGVRLLRTRLLGRMLKEHLITTCHPSVVIKGHEAAALALLREIHGNLARARDELDRYRAQHGQTSRPNLRLAPDLERMIAEAQLGTYQSADDDSLAEDQARLVLLGDVIEGHDHYWIGPALGDLDAKLWKTTFDALSREIDQRLRTGKPAAEHYVHTTLELQADALFRQGKTEDGVARLQRFLDEYPTSTQFENVTRRINIELGLTHNPEQNDLINYPDKGLKQCDYFAIYRGASQVLHRRVAVKGSAGVAETVAEIERACGTSTKIYWSSLYSMLAGTAASFGECELSRQLWHKFLDHNGSPKDLEGYLKRQPSCPLEP